jgi:hypothetical protein
MSNRLSLHEGQIPLTNLANADQVNQWKILAVPWVCIKRFLRNDNAEWYLTHILVLPPRPIRDTGWLHLHVILRWYCHWLLQSSSDECKVSICIPDAMLLQYWCSHFPVDMPGYVSYMPEYYILVLRLLARLFLYTGPGQIPSLLNATSFRQPGTIFLSFLCHVTCTVFRHNQSGQYSRMFLSPVSTASRGLSNSRRQVKR